MLWKQAHIDQEMQEGAFYAKTDNKQQEEEHSRGGAQQKTTQHNTSLLLKDTHQVRFQSGSPKARPYAHEDKDGNCCGTKGRSHSVWPALKKKKEAEELTRIER